MLKFHREFTPPAFYFVWNLPGHFSGASVFLLRVGENAEPLEFRLADEIEQRLKIFLRLAGKTDDERRAQRDAGNPGADAFEQVHDVLLRSLAPHPLEHVFVDVLERNVHVARDFRTLRNGLDQFIRPVRGMRVEQTNPEISFKRIQLAQQAANRRCIGGQRFGGG